MFLLNPDTVIKENIFQQVLTEFKDKYIGKGIIGLNVNSSKFLDYSSGLFPNFFLELLNVFLIGRYFEAAFIKLKTLVSRTKKVKVEWIMGAALFIRKDLFTEINGFDPDYFLYFEEMDLCKRVTDRRLPVTYLPDLKIEHLGSVSSKKNYYFFTKMFYKGKLLFLKKHSNKLTYAIYKILFFLIIINQIIFWRLINSKNKEKSLGKIKAFQEILKNLDYPGEISNLPV